MQNPSDGVQPPLDKHVHLISGHQYPPIAQLNLQQAFEYLVQAPMVVKQVAPMAWTYVSAPQNGTVWLEWIAPSQSGARYPSDGYVWADPEQVYHQSFNGYQIELLVHQVGFRPGFDHMTSHARTRYHLVNKAPNVNAPPPDPSLWIVHYHHAPQQRILPTQQVQIDAYTRRIMSDRQWLESQGRIERRDFMLHDREHWPYITPPGQARQQQTQGHGFQPPNAVPNQGPMPGARYYQQPFPASTGTPSAKRQRTQGPGSVATGADAGVDQNIEEDEYTALGDYFDHLTPREISMARYQQHHNWIEEVFASPYASADIVPPDLGLGLMGELKGLTEGLLAAPSVAALLDDTVTEDRIEVSAPAFTNIPKEQLDQFSERVQKHIDEGKAEIERMKADHAAKMRAWRGSHKLTKAEKQLRDATWKGYEPGILSAPAASADSERPAVVEDIVDSLEQSTGQKVKSYTDATLVEKGGLEEIERVTQLQRSNPTDGAPSAGSQQPQAMGAELTGTNTQQISDADASATAQDEADQNDGLDLLNESMDLDTGDLHFDLGDMPAEQISSANGDAQIDQGLTSTAEVEKQINGASSDVNASVDSAHAQQQQQQQTNTNSGGTGGANDAGAGLHAGDGSLFDEAAFGFENDGNGEVGDGLIDFGDDNMGLDDNFGDALHGMD